MATKPAAEPSPEPPSLLNAPIAPINSINTPVTAPKATASFLESIEARRARDKAKIPIARAMDNKALALS